MLALIVRNWMQEAAKESLGVDFLFYSVYCAYLTQNEVNSEMLSNLALIYRVFTKN